MAFVLPVFFTVILGMVELGRGIMVEQLVTNAAREAAPLGHYRRQHQHFGRILPRRFCKAQPGSPPAT